MIQIRTLSYRGTERLGHRNSISTDIGLDVPTIRSAQAKISAGRQQPIAERILGLEAKIGELKEKTVESVSRETFLS
jgi:hypothetical protein